MRTLTAALFLGTVLVVQPATIFSDISITNNSSSGTGTGTSSNELQCQVFDRNGTSLESSTNGAAGRLLCVYSGAGICKYTFNGSYVSGAPACPPSAQDSSGVSGNLNASASALTGFSTPSGSASLPAVSATSEKKRPSAGLVAGIVIMSAALLIILSLALLFQRRSKHRRAAERHAIQIKRQTDTISPFTLINQIGGPDSRGIDAKKERLRTELSVMQEKMVNLEDLERRTTSGSNAPRILRLQLGRSTRAGSRQGTSRDAAAVQDLEGKLQACKQHIDTLVNRINELETNADFAWGMGVSGEPPPDYV